MTSRVTTDVQIRNNLKPKAKRYEQKISDTRGLYVVVQPSGTKSFCVRFRYAGVSRKLTLQPGISLDAARALAANAMYEVAQGRNPAAEQAVAKIKTRAALKEARENSVQAICENYLKREGAKLRTTAIRARTLQRLVYSELGGQDISTVRRSQITRLLDRIEDEHGSRAADLVLSYLRRIFGWHAQRTDDFNSPIVRGMTRYSKKEHERSRILDDDEIKKIWDTASAQSGPFAALVRFLLLTAARRGEAAGLEFSEVEGDLWRLPATRNKTKVELVRPLSEDAQSIVAAQPHIDGGLFVFSRTGRCPLWFSQEKKNFDQACGVSDWRLHDLRRTSRTLMSRAGINADIAERCLGHAIGGTRAVYDRHRYTDQMKLAFEQLAAQIRQIVSPPHGAVLSFARK